MGAPQFDRWPAAHGDVGEPLVGWQPPTWPRSTLSCGSFVLLASTTPVSASFFCPSLPRPRRLNRVGNRAKNHRSAPPQPGERDDS